MAEDSQIEVDFAPGVALRGTVEGDGADLVCLHGLTASRRYVLQGSRSLSRSGFRVTAYDARGHGQSDPAPAPSAYEYRDLVADLERVLPDRPVALAGSSMGAHTALAFALENPERVTAVVAITPAFFGRAPRDDERWAQLADACAAGDIGRFVEIASYGGSDLVKTAVRQRMEAHRALAPIADALRVVPWSQPFDLDRLAELAVPALVVGSRDDMDPGHPLKVAERYAELIPDARLVVEEPGESPIAWRGSQLSKAIGAFLDPAYS